MAKRTYPSLRAFLDDKGLTQAEFGQHFKIAQSTVSKILNGRVRLPLELALRIAAHTNVPVAALLPGEARRRAS